MTGSSNRNGVHMTSATQLRIRGARKDRRQRARPWPSVLHSLFSRGKKDHSSFPPKWAAGLRRKLLILSKSIRHNDTQQEEFDVTRGVRQSESRDPVAICEREKGIFQGDHGIPIYNFWESTWWICEETLNQPCWPKIAHVNFIQRWNILQGPWDVKYWISNALWFHWGLMTCSWLILIGGNYTNESLRSNCMAFIDMNLLINYLQTLINISPTILKWSALNLIQELLNIGSNR